MARDAGDSDGRQRSTLAKDIDSKPNSRTAGPIILAVVGMVNLGVIPVHTPWGTLDAPRSFFSNPASRDTRVIASYLTAHP
jgi:hypothetical protein